MSDSESTGTEQAQAEQAQATANGTATGATTASTKSGFTKGAKALIGGLGLGAALYLGARSFKRFVWPEKGKLKRGVQILLMGGTFYWATHCGSVNAKIENFYKGHVKPTVVEWKTGNEKISSLEQKTQRLEESKIAVEANYQKTQGELKAESEKAKTLESDYKIEKEKSKGLAKTLDEKDARIKVQEGYISDLERQVREGMKRVDEQRTAGPVASSQAPSIGEGAIANYPPDSNLSSPGYSLPSALSKYEGNFASHFSYIIYVDKDENKLSLFKSHNGELDLVKQYNCSTGTNPNNKVQQGDKATPEGVFFAEYRNFSPNLTGLYGDGIVGLTGNFPGIVLCGANYSDRISAIRQGKSITNGGVILENPDLNDLDARIGRDYSEAAFVIEHSARPLGLRFGK